MSQENVEIVRAAIDAWSRGDWDTALKDTAPDFEYDLSRAIGPIRGVYRRDQTEEAWRDFTEGLTFARIEPHELIEAGEHVVVPWTYHAVGRDGIEVQARTTWLFTLRDSRVDECACSRKRRRPSKPPGRRSRRCRMKRRRSCGGSSMRPTGLM
jgi:ketosteroid isomerase-like protein